MNRQRFFDNMAPYAQQASEALGLPVSLILVQWGHESGFGTGPTFPYNNPAGIKRVTSSPYQSGKAAGHAAYDSLDNFTQDYIRVMRLPYYRNILAAGDDVPAAIQAWDASLYATDPDYGSKLRNLYNRYAPTYYDENGGQVAPVPVPGGHYHLDGDSVTITGNGDMILPLVVGIVGLILLAGIME